MADSNISPSPKLKEMNAARKEASRIWRDGKTLAELSEASKEAQRRLNELLEGIDDVDKKNKIIEMLRNMSEIRREMRLAQMANESPEMKKVADAVREEARTSAELRRAEHKNANDITKASPYLSEGMDELDVQKCLKNMYSALLPGSGKSFPGDFPMEKFPKDFDMDKYVDGLCNFRKEFLEAEIKAAEKGEKIQFSLRDNKNFQEMLRIDDEMNRMLASDDIQIRESARAAKDEAWRRATERSAEEEIDRLKKLNPEASEEFAENRRKAAVEWIQSWQKEFQGLFGRPDNMFGMFVLASLAPSMVALFTIPVALPFLLSIGNIFEKLFADAIVEDMRNEKLSIEKRVVMDASVATALRAAGSAAERNGLSPGEGLNMVVNMLSNPDSVVGKFKEALHEMHENGVKFDSPEATKIFLDIAKNLREANAPGIDVMGEYLKAEIRVNGDVLEYAVEPNVDGESPKETIDNVMAFLKGPDEDIKKYFVTKEEGAGDRSSIRPGEAVVLCKALAKGWPEEAEKMKKLCEELALRILPSSAVLLDGGDRRYFMDKILRSHGDCFRTELPDADESHFRLVSPDEKDVNNLSKVILNGRKYWQASPYIDDETLKTTSLEHVIIGAAEGRARYQDEMRRRAREEQESFRQELVHCCDRMVHPVMREMEEYANVGFGETTKRYVKKEEAEKTPPEEMRNKEEEKKVARYAPNGKIVGDEVSDGTLGILFDEFGDDEDVWDEIGNTMTGMTSGNYFYADSEDADLRHERNREVFEVDGGGAQSKIEDILWILDEKFDETSALYENATKKVKMEPVEKDTNTVKTTTVPVARTPYIGLPSSNEILYPENMTPEEGSARAKADEKLSAAVSVVNAAIGEANAAIDKANSPVENTVPKKDGHGHER